MNEPSLSKPPLNEPAAPSRSDSVNLGSTETELKLALNRRLTIAVRELQREFGRTSGRERGRRQSHSTVLSTVYVDTPDDALAAQRIALRIRSIGDKVRVQTVKAAGTGPFSRFEHEAPIDTEGPSLAALPVEPAALVQALHDAWPRLQPVFETRFRRAAQTVEPLPGLLVEVAIDRGEIVAASRPGERELIAEVEFELVQGTHEAFWRWARDWTAGLDARLLIASKNDRGRRLCGREPSVPRVVTAKDLAPPVETAADGTTLAAARLAVLAQLQHLLGNIEAIRLGKDPRGPHQLRVALRRLRTLLRFFKPALEGATWAPIIELSRRLAESAGRVRDLDVFRAGLHARIAAIATEDDAVTAVGKALDRQCDLARHALRADLEGPDFTRLVVSLMAAVEALPVTALDPRSATITDGLGEKPSSTIGPDNDAALDGKADVGSTAPGDTASAGNAPAGYAAGDAAPAENAPAGNATDDTAPVGNAPAGNAPGVTTDGETFGAFALVRMRDLVHEAIRQCRRAHRSADAASRHRLRIALKNLRYALNFSCGALSDRIDAPRWLQELSQWQDELGAEQDLAMGRQMAQTVLRGSACPAHLCRRYSAMFDLYVCALEAGGSAHRTPLDRVQKRLKRLEKRLDKLGRHRSGRR